MVIDFLQNVIRQKQAVNLPAPLSRDTGRIVIKIFVVGFQKTKVGLVSVQIWPGVGAKENAVGVGKAKAAGGVRLAAKLGG